MRLLVYLTESDEFAVEKTSCPTVHTHRLPDAAGGLTIYTVYLRNRNKHAAPTPAFRGDADAAALPAKNDIQPLLTVFKRGIRALDTTSSCYSKPRQTICLVSRPPLIHC